MSYSAHSVGGLGRVAGRPERRSYAPAVELVVGVDMATADVRAVVADADGRILASGHAPLPAPSSPRPGWSEQDASSWWPAVCAAVGQLGDFRRSVVAITVCATSGTVVALDGEGRPLGPALMYSDQRAVAEAEVAQEAGRGQVGCARAAGAADVRPAQVGLAAAQRAVDSPAGPCVGRRRRPAGGRGPPAATDWGHALKSGYDPARGEWATEAMEALGIPCELLPEVRRPTEVAGRVSDEAAAVTGLPAGCRVRLGTTDACAAQLAAGAGAPGRFVSVLGSTLVLKGASRELVVDPAGAVYSHRHPDGWWLPGGASNVGARVLQAEFGGRDLGALDAAAAEHGPAGAVVYPLVGTGERFPFAAPDAEAFSLGDAADEVDRYRALLEGVAFVERLGYERLADLGAAADPPIAVSGGGSGSPVWNRIRATVLGAPVTATPAATTALGACILAAAGTLHPDLAAATEAMAATGEPVEPVGEEQAALDDGYRRFLAAVTERGWLGTDGRR